MEQFVEKFREQFIDGDELTMSGATEFRSFDSWDSLTGMSVLVMIKDEYGVDMPEEALRACNTIEEVFQYVTKHKV